MKINRGNFLVVKVLFVSFLRKIGRERYWYDYIKFHPWREFDEFSVVYRLLTNAVRTGCMMDVGAHFGESALPYLAKGWDVYSFEPDISNSKTRELEKIADFYNKFHLCRDVISNRDGKEVAFYTSEESTGISSIIPFTKKHRRVARLKTKSLSSYIEDCDKSLQNVDFLKIDTEGNDLKVLQGFPFSTVMPKIVMCEFEDAKTIMVGYTYHDLGDYLMKKGYQVFLSEWHPINRYGEKHRWRGIKKYPCNLRDPCGWGNYIAVKEEYATAVEEYITK